MGMANLHKACAFLGPMYAVKSPPGGEVIYRKISDSLEFEITGFFGAKEMTVNLWQILPHVELMAIYSGITTLPDLADTLGFLAFRYQNVAARVRVEREDPLQ